MSSFEKVVKGACKPKPNPPKAKYLDPILAATWSEDGAVHDVCRALAPRFREPNVLIVFKALIVLHMMIRNGSTDNVLSYLSSSDVLKLRNVSAGNWEGYNAPQNIQHYATYLDHRIRAYRELKHDAIRVQSENNRDMRNSNAIEEGRDRPDSGSRRSRPRDPPPSSGVQRSKTLAGRKLRVMTVEKGLLRETKIVQRMIDSLLECRFYLDDLDNELNITAFRMLVKDLLILFQACNEGVINVLEHYFEMFRSDAEEALNLYRRFCKQTEQVVEYLGVAKKLQNILNVPIPNLRHAPVSLVGALEEYLNDPNFEQNRIEYKTNKDAAEKAERLGVRAAPVQSKPQDNAPEPKPSSSTGASSPDGEQAKPATSQAMIDFFSAIEGEQQPMFNPQTNSPSTAYFQQHAVHNPFAQQMQQMPMMTGVPFGASQPFAQPQVQAMPQMQPQPTGFIVPQYTSTNPFGMQMAQQQQQPSSFLQPQQTSFLQPQTTGANPFRQSMLLPQMTGMQAFGMGMTAPQPQPASTNPFPIQATGQPGLSNGSTIPNFNMFSAMAGSSQVAQPTAQLAGADTTNGSAYPVRPGSAPLTALSSSSTSSISPPKAEPVKSHQTGSRNPFGTPVTAPPPVPKPPTLFELAMGGSQNNQLASSQGSQQQTSPNGSGFGMDSFASRLGPQQTGSVMANVASEFSFGKVGQTNSSGTTSPQHTSATGTSSTFSDTLFSSLSSQPTGATTTSLGSSHPSISISPAAPLQPHRTGFSGMKPFKPSSSFGAALLESLPPIPSAPSTPNEVPQPTFPAPSQNGTVNGQNNGTGNAFGNGTSGLGGLGSLGTQQTGFGGFNSQPTGTFNTQSNSGLNNQPTGAFNPQSTGPLASQSTGAFGALGKSTVGTGLRPQMTGAAGAANPFRATMFATSSTMPTGTFSTANATGTTSPFGSSPFPMNGTSPGQFGMGQMGQNISQPQQQNGSTSLI